MLRQHIVCGWLLAAALGAGCSGGGGPAPSPINPFGTDPAVVTDSEPAGTNNEAPASGSASGSIEQLCASACANIQATCPDAAAAGTSDCASSCATSDTSGCETQFKALVACLATAMLSCTGDQVTAPGCMGAELAVNDCVNQASP